MSGLSTLSRRVLLPPHVRIEAGVRADYDLLKSHHYRKNDCAVFTRIWKAYIPVSNAIIGVLTEACPPLACRHREALTNGRYSMKEDIRAGARLLNKEVRTISRVVVHPAYRRLGIATALLRHALAHSRTRYVEARTCRKHAGRAFESAGMQCVFVGDWKEVPSYYFYELKINN